MIPSQVKGIAAVGLSIGLAGVASHGQQIPTDALQVATLMVEQVLVGLLLAFAVGALMAAVQTAGGLADIVSGFSFGATVDPINGNQGGTFSELYSLVGVMLFIAIGGDAWVLHGIARTFDLVPLTAGPAPRPDGQRRRGLGQHDVRLVHRGGGAGDPGAARSPTSRSGWSRRSCRR